VSSERARRAGFAGVVRPRNDRDENTSAEFPRSHFRHDRFVPLARCASPGRAQINGPGVFRFNGLVRRNPSEHAASIRGVITVRLKPDTTEMVG
jgi:hypothetical protein